MIDPDDEDQKIIVCQGPPFCEHVLGDGFELPCELCRIITLHPDGSETDHNPVRLQ